MSVFLLSTLRFSAIPPDHPFFLACARVLHIPTEVQRARGGASINTLPVFQRTTPHDRRRLFVDEMLAAAQMNTAYQNFLCENIVLHQTLFLESAQGHGFSIDEEVLASCTERLRNVTFGLSDSPRPITLADVIDHVIAPAAIELHRMNAFGYLAS